jgi:hypothetical protein
MTSPLADDELASLEALCRPGGEAVTDPTQKQPGSKKSPSKIVEVRGIVPCECYEGSSGERCWIFRGVVPTTASRRLRKQGQLWPLLFRMAICKPPKRPPKHASVAIQVARKRPQDIDKALASVKPILDHMKRAGWIMGDSQRHITLRVVEHRAQRQATLIYWAPDCPR